MSKKNVTYQFDQDIIDLITWAAGRSGISRTEIMRRLALAYCAGTAIPGLLILKPHPRATKLLGLYT